jgi:hypothetical protein
VLLTFTSTCSIIAGRGIRKVIADSGQSSTQELQCQHSSGYLIIGGLPFFISKTSVGQMSAQIPQTLHFVLLMIGGIVFS